MREITVQFGVPLYRGLGGWEGDECAVGDGDVGDFRDGVHLLEGGEFEGTVGVCCAGSGEGGFIGRR